MLTEALIEREIRNATAAAGLTGIPLYPEQRNCPAPASPRILEIFNGIQRHHPIGSDDTIIQTFEPDLVPLHHQVLERLHIPATIYNSAALPEAEVGAHSG